MGKFNLAGRGAKITCVRGLEFFFSPRGLIFIKKLVIVPPKIVERKGFSTNKSNQGDERMSKAMTKGQIVAGVAEKVGITKKQAGEAVEALATMAYKNAKNGFTVPGLGKLVLVNRKARMGRNPATGAEIKIPAKRVVKFRVAKACKDAILG
jgi:DNA-binding protein HU-beta